MEETTENQEGKTKQEAKKNIKQIVELYNIYRCSPFPPVGKASKRNSAAKATVNRAASSRVPARAAEYQ